MRRRGRSLLLLFGALLELTNRRRARRLAKVLTQQLLLVESQLAKRVVVRPAVAGVAAVLGLETLALAPEDLRVGTEGEDARR